MSRILVLGGGQMGAVIAADLAADHEVAVADIRPLQLGGIETICADLRDTEKLVSLLGEYDLAVGALPGAVGFGAAQAAVVARRNYVDVSFFAEDVAELHKEATRAGVAIVPDCGIAPGITHLITGRAVAFSPRRAIHIRVGGIAEDASRPYGYVVTWSVEDLIEEYERPARFVKEGRVVTAPALTGLEKVGVVGVGELEAFFTDGLRTLLDLDGVPEMTEKTMRWPGHVEAIRPLLEQGKLAAELEEKCSEGRDLVCIHIQVDGEAVTMVDRATDQHSAMARTTALSTAAFARWVADERFNQVGVVAPETFGRDPEAYRFILTRLQEHGIRLDPPLPFLAG